MKRRILLLLLFNLSIAAAFSQANTYHKSIHIINSDSTHGELNGTEYINSDGLYRYKENGVWKYRASTADISGSGITNSAAANELMKSDGTDAVASGIFSSSSGDMDLGTTSIAGNRTIRVRSSTSNANLHISAQNNGHIWLETEGSNRLKVSVNGVGIGDAGEDFTPVSELEVRDMASPTADNVQTVLTLTHGTSGTPATGIGGGIDFRVETASANEEVVGSIQAVTTSVSSGNEYADLVFKAMGQGALGEAFRISQLAGPTTRLTVQGQSADISSTGWKFNANTSITTNFKVGVQESATIDRRLHVEDYSTVTNTVLYPFRMTRAVQAGNGATGVGTGMEYEWENGSGTNVVGATIEAVATDATSGSEDSDLVFKLMKAGASATELARLTSLSDFKLTTAGSVGPFVTFVRTGGTASTWQIKPDLGSTDFAIQDDVGGQEYLFNTAGTATAVDWVATSDRRLKYHFKPVGSQLDKIATISDLVTNYDRKDNGKNETGFIAQELLKVAPEYVNAPADTASGYYSVNYAKMSAILFKGVDELNAKIEELNQRIKELESQLSSRR